MPDLNLTGNQQRAIAERGKNIVVVAGAGAGKTRVLVERYLSLLADGKALPSLVAITFTEKAAREMRDRVRRTIEERAASGDALWEQCRRQIDAARIITIHSLCASLLRANPAEARVDPRFEVLEEPDAALMQDDAIDAVLTELAETGGGALDLLAAYEIATVRDTLRRLFQQGGAVDDAFSRLAAAPDALLAAWQTQIDFAREQGLARLLTGLAWCDAVEWLHKNSASDPDDKLEQVRVEDAGLISSMESIGALQVVREFATRPKVGSRGSAKSWDDVKHARQMLNALRDQARDFHDRFDLELTDDDRRAGQLIFLWREVWRRVRAEYARQKSTVRGLDFDDLEEGARALLRDCPDVRARYRAEFACVLVDEFQDTNSAQRDIVYALSAPDEVDRLFIVADGKQSIYGFRGADVSVFTAARAEITRCWGRDAVIPLVESFRAHTRLVDAFNYLFAILFAVEGEPAPYEIAYEPMVAPRPSLDREPLIEIISIPDEKQLQGVRREREAEELARRLRELIQTNLQVWDKETRSYRPARWGDVALLFRATTHFPIYEEAFKRARIPYVTFAGKGYFDRPEVRDLITLLRALDNPADDFAVATVLRSPLYALSDETLYRLRRDGKAFRAAMADPPPDIPQAEHGRVEFARTSLGRLWKRVGRVTILELLNDALAQTDYLATITTLSDGERRRGNVEKLLALARRTGKTRLGEFNAYLQDLTAQEVREGEAVVEAENAVKLMSIHRAKGLEFPIVVIPDASRAPREDSDVLLLDRELGVAASIRDARGKRIEPAAYRMLKGSAVRRQDAEEKRLLYVAATRAQDYLIFSGGAKLGKKSYLEQILNALDGQTAFGFGTIEIREPTVTFEEPSAGTPSPRAVTPEPLSEIPPLVAPLAAPASSNLDSVQKALEWLRNDASADALDDIFFDEMPEVDDA